MTVPRLSPREQQAMDAVRALGSASACEVLEQMESPPSYSTVRSILAVLEEKGHLRHERKGRRFVYSPVVSHADAQRSAFRHLLATLFVGSPANAFSTLLDIAHADLTDEDLEHIQAMIEQARAEGP